MCVILKLEYQIKMKKFFNVLLVFIFFETPSLFADTTKGAVRVSWERVDDATVAGYRVHYGNISRTYTRTVEMSQPPAGIVPRMIFQGLDKTKKYYFAVTAFSVTNEESDFSDEVGVEFTQPSVAQVVSSKLVSKSEIPFEIGETEKKMVTKTMDIVWKWDPKKSYSVQRSYDLKKWDTIDSIYSESGLIEYSFILESDKSSTFFRLQLD